MSKRSASTIMRVVGVIALVGVAVLWSNAQDREADRVPEAVHPREEQVSARFRALQQQAIARPTGQRSPDGAPLTPAVASPQR